MADIATIEEAKRAESLGFDYISSTLHGYTENTIDVKLPDLEFLKKLKSEIKNSIIIAEGGIREVSELKAIINMGYKYIVIGSAITRPQLITKMYVSAFH